MIYHEVINISVTYSLSDICNEFFLESALDSIDQGNLFICNNIGIVTYSDRNRPETFKQDLVIIIDANIEYSFAYLFHIGNLFNVQHNSSVRSQGWHTVITDFENHMDRLA